MFDNLGEQLQQAIIDNDRWQMYLEGLGVTIVMSLGAIVIGVILGTLVALLKVKAKRTKNVGIKILNVICDIYLTVIRGTPSMLQILIWFLIIFASWPMNMGVLIAIIAFGFNSGAYVAEIIRSGIQAVDKGQSEAARSLGLTGRQTMRYIVLPQAVKNILPALGNEFILIIKDTSLASIFFIGDLMTVQKSITTSLYLSLEPMAIVGMIYFSMTFVLSKLVRAYERRVSVG